MTAPAAWCHAADALEFQPAGHGAGCLVHRRAFRVLLGRASTGEEPQAADCLAFYGRNAAAFEAAAADKIARRGLAPAARFHLTSRDVRRAMGDASGRQVAAPAETLQEMAGQHAQQRP
jgi:hypothetical protein